MNVFILIYFKFYLFFSFLLFKKYCLCEYEYSHFKYFPPKKIEKKIKKNNNFLAISINYEQILICGSNRTINFDKENIANISDEKNNLKLNYFSDIKYYNKSNKIFVACDDDYLLKEFSDEEFDEFNNKISYDSFETNGKFTKCELSKDSNRFRKNQIGIHNFTEFIISAAAIEEEEKKYFIAVVSNNDIFSIQFESVEIPEEKNNFESSSSNSESNSDSSNSESNENINENIKNPFKFNEHLEIENNKKEKIITSQFINDDQFHILTCHIEGKGHYKHLKFSIYSKTSISFGNNKLSLKYSLILNNTNLKEFNEENYCYEFRNIELFKIKNNFFSLMFECYHRNSLNFINIHIPNFNEIKILNYNSFNLDFINQNIYRFCIDYFTFPIFCAFYDYSNKNEKNSLFLFGFYTKFTNEENFFIDGYFKHEINDFNDSFLKNNNENKNSHKINFFLEANYSDLILVVENKNTLNYARIKFPVCNDFNNFFKSNVDRHFYQNEIAEDGMIFNNENEMQIYIEKIEDNNENACEFRLSKTKDEITIFGKNHQKCVFYYVLIPKFAAENGFLTDKCEIKYQNCPENCFFCKNKNHCDQCKPIFALDYYDKCLCNKTLNYWIRFSNGTEKCIRQTDDLNEQKCIENYEYLNIYTNECMNDCPQTMTKIEEKKECKCDETNEIYYENKCHNKDDFDESKNFINNSIKIDCTLFDQLYHPLEKKCVSSCEKSNPNYHPIKGFCLTCKNNEFISPEGNCIEECESNQFKYEENLKYCFKEKCPQSHPIKKNHICKDYCDDNEFEYNNECHKTCPEKTYEFKQRCICDRNESLWYYETEDDFTYIVCNDTLDECPDEKPFKINATNECVESCPKKYPYYYENVCIDKCEYPYEFYIDNSQSCAEKCPENYFRLLDNKVCYEHCPKDKNVTYILNNTNFCIENCTKDYGYFAEDENKCYFDGCPSKYKALQGDSKICLLEYCPTEFPFYLDTVNLTTEEIAQYENRCYDNCPENHDLIANERFNICYTVCPTDFPNVDLSTRTCHLNCPDQKILLVDNQTCSNICPEDRYLSEDKKYCFIECPKEPNEKYKYYYKNKYSKKCVLDCETDAYFKYRIEELKECESSCTKDFPNVIYEGKICYKTCPTKPNYEYLLEEKKTCVNRCNIDEKYKYHIVKEKKCAESCTEKYPNIELNKMECFDECPIDYKFLLPNNKTCMNECPPHFISNESICIIVTDYVQDENIDNEDKLNAIAKNLAYLSNEMSVITLENDKTVEVVSTSRKVEYDNLSSIDLSECEAILRETYKIPKDEDLLILKIDTVTTTSVKNEVNYEVYTKNGTKLNLDPCSKVTVSISSPITNPEALKLDLAKDLEKEGVDIYNTEGEFYNNYCFSYSSGGNDMTLNDRYSNIYPDVDVCESGCVYNGINMTTNKISCNCNPTNFTENSSENEKIDGKSFFLNLKNYFNYKLFSCFDYVLHFEKKYILNNFGFWFSLIIMSLEFVCFFLCVFFLISYVRKKVFDNFDESLKSRLKSLKIRKANKIIVKKKKKIALVKTNHFDISSARMIKQKNVLKSNKIIKSEEDFSKEEFSEMPFETAIKKDTRNVLKIIVTLIFAKLEFLKILFFKEEYEFYPLLISVYLMSLHLDFSLNALLYSDDVVSQKYNNGGSLNFVTILGLGFFANFIGNIICKSLEKLTLYNFPLEGLVKEVKDKKKFKLLEKMIKIIKKRLAIFFALQFVLSMMCSYYLFVFCNVYGASQGSLFVNYLTGIAQSLFISVGIAFGIAIARYFGLKLKIKYLYYFSRLVDQQFE